MNCEFTSTAIVPEDGASKFCAPKPATDPQEAFVPVTHESLVACSLPLPPTVVVMSTTGRARVSWPEAGLAIDTASHDDSTSQRTMQRPRTTGATHECAPVGFGGSGVSELNVGCCWRRRFRLRFFAGLACVRPTRFAGCDSLSLLGGAGGRVCAGAGAGADACATAGTAAGAAAGAGGAGCATVSLIVAAVGGCGGVWADTTGFGSSGNPLARVWSAGSRACVPPRPTLLLVGSSNSPGTKLGTARRAPAGPKSPLVITGCAAECTSSACHDRNNRLPCSHPGKAWHTGEHETAVGSVVTGGNTRPRQHVPSAPRPPRPRTQVRS